MKRRPIDLESRLRCWDSVRTLRKIIGKSLPRIDCTRQTESIKTWNGHFNQIVVLTTILKINNIRLMRSWLKTVSLTWRKSRNNSRGLKTTRSGPNLISFAWLTRTRTIWKTVTSSELWIKKTTRMIQRINPNCWSKRRPCWLIDSNKPTRLSSKWSSFYKQLVTRAQSNSSNHRNKRTRRNTDCSRLLSKNEQLNQSFKLQARFEKSSHIFYLRPHLEILKADIGRLHQLQQHSKYSSLTRQVQIN